MSRLLAAGFLLLVLLGVGRRPARPLFRDVAEESGLRFRHFTGSTGEYFMPEIMGAGGALFDYDGDGDLDVFLVQGAMLDPGKAPSALDVPRGPGPARRPPALPQRSAAWHLGPPEPRFTDVTDKAGLAPRRLRHGSGGRRLRQRRPPRPLPDELRPRRALPQQRRRHLHRRDRGRRRGRPALEHERLLLRLRPRRPPGPLRRQLSRLHGGRQQGLLRAPGRPRLLQPQRPTAPCPTDSSTTRAAAASRT